MDTPYNIKTHTCTRTHTGGHCKSLAPEYEKAAEQLASYVPKVTLAKVDATAEQQSAKEHEVQGFPTLKFFVKGEASEYNGGRTADTIVSWVKKKTGPPTKTISTPGDLDAFTKEGEVVVVGSFSSAEKLKAFEDAARSDDSIQYASNIGSSPDFLAAMGVTKTDSIVLIKKFDEGRAEYTGDITSSADIRKFVSGNSLPLIIPFNQQTAQKIFGGAIKRQFLLFLDSQNVAESDKAKDALRPVAKEFRGEVVFVTIDKTDERVLEFFGVKGATDLPTTRLVSMVDQGMKKYKMVAPAITAENAKASIEKLLKGELAADLKSEEIPSSNEGPVKVIVGKSFDDVVTKRGEKDVFVEYYAPWCGHCKSLAPIWEELAEKYKSNPNLVIAKMDATANEHESVQISGFPTLKFYPGNGGEVEDYSGARELDALVSFLEKNAKSCAA